MITLVEREQERMNERECQRERNKICVYTGGNRIVRVAEDERKRDDDNDRYVL